MLRMAIYSSSDLMFNMRVGFGKDIHKTKKGCKLILGGIEISNKFGLVSHSDGDVVIHAIVDALLGAMNKGDIGKLFPPTDLSLKGVSSVKFLEETGKILAENGYFVGNIDVFITCERPKLSSFTGLMKEKISSILGIDIDKVSIKCGTNEGFGWIGKCKAIEAECVALIEKVK